MNKMILLLAAFVALTAGSIRAAGDDTKDQGMSPSTQDQGNKTQQGSSDKNKQSDKSKKNKKKKKAKEVKKTVNDAEKVVK